MSWPSSEEFYCVVTHVRQLKLQLYAFEEEDFFIRSVTLYFGRGNLNNSAEIENFSLLSKLNSNTLPFSKHLFPDHGSYSLFYSSLKLSAR